MATARAASAEFAVKAQQVLMKARAFVGPQEYSALGLRARRVRSAERAGAARTACVGPQECAAIATAVLLEPRVSVAQQPDSPERAVLQRESLGLEAKALEVKALVGSAAAAALVAPATAKQREYSRARAPVGEAYEVLVLACRSPAADLSGSLPEPPNQEMPIGAGAARHRHRSI